MSPAQGGTQVVQQRRLRTQLRRAREDAGRTQKEVAQALGWSNSKIIRIETGATSVSTSDVMALLHYYGIHDPDRTEDLLAVTRAKEAAWYDEYREFYSQNFLNFLGFEDSAARLKQFQVGAIPGLLQTEGYMGTAFRRYDAERRQRAVTVRLRRQHILEDESREFQFLLDEAVIHRVVGSPEVMAEQLRRLVEESRRRPNVSIRIVPFTAGSHAGMSGPFAVLEFDGDVPSVLNLERPHTDVRLNDDPETVANYLETFYELEDIAAPEDELPAYVEEAIAWMNRRKG